MRPRTRWLLSSYAAAPLFVVLFVASLVSHEWIDAVTNVVLVMLFVLFDLGRRLAYRWGRDDGIMDAFETIRAAETPAEATRLLVETPPPWSNDYLDPARRHVSDETDEPPID